MKRLGVVCLGVVAMSAGVHAESDITSSSKMVVLRNAQMDRLVPSVVAIAPLHAVQMGYGGTGLNAVADNGAAARAGAARGVDPPEPLNVSPHGPDLIGYAKDNPTPSDGPAGTWAYSGGLQAGQFRLTAGGVGDAAATTAPMTTRSDAAAAPGSGATPDVGMLGATDSAEVNSGTVSRFATSTSPSSSATSSATATSPGPSSVFVSSVTGTGFASSLARARSFANR
jgi:hypothetical protein